MIIRTAREEDVSKICALLAHPAMRGDVLPRSEQAISMSLDDWSVGTDDQDCVLGCIALEERRSDLAEIRSLSVSPLARGQGFASALLRTAVAQAWRRGFTSVFAQTRALSLFERAGFRHMADDAEHRPLCGRMLRAGYHRVRIDVTPLSLCAPELSVGPMTPEPAVDTTERDAAVGRPDVAPEGPAEPIASDPEGIAPPGFHFHRYRSVAATRPHVVM